MHKHEYVDTATHLMPSYFFLSSMKGIFFLIDGPSNFPTIASLSRLLNRLMSIERWRLYNNLQHSSILQGLKFVIYYTKKKRTYKNMILLRIKISSNRIMTRFSANCWAKWRHQSIIIYIFFLDFWVCFGLSIINLIRRVNAIWSDMIWK
jgi:hypothetical protein